MSSIICANERGDRMTIGENITLWHGDCLDLMHNVADKSVDMILTDLPYG